MNMNGDMHLRSLMSLLGDVAPARGTVGLVIGIADNENAVAFRIMQSLSLSLSVFEHDSELRSEWLGEDVGVVGCDPSLFLN
jgi:hypothetical protein